jgi:uridylate kinase
VLLKLSGEAPAGEQGLPIDLEVVSDSRRRKKVHALGRAAIVIGGGNIVRGLSASEQGIDRATGITWDARHADQQLGAAGSLEKSA